MGGQGGHPGRPRGAGGGISPARGGNVRRTKGARTTAISYKPKHHQQPMPRNHKMHVWEVQQSAQPILEFTDGKTLQDYTTDQILKAAVERQINKISGVLASLIVNNDPNARRIRGYRCQSNTARNHRMNTPHNSPSTLKSRRCIP